MTSSNKIFVQIPSYRDPDLASTLISLIDQAAIPTNIRAVVCWQHGDDEGVCAIVASGFDLVATINTEGFVTHHLARRGAKIELVDVPFEQAQGAGWARSVAQHRFNGEAYNLQIDAHHRFIPKWDAALISMLEGLRKVSSKPILTGYPPSFNPKTHPDGSQISTGIMLVDSFNAAGIVRFRAATLPAERKFTSPLRARFMSAGFVFSDGRFVREVAQDPGHFFSTEEIVLSARSFTHGFDPFHPHVPVLWHDYASEAPEVWDDLTDELRARGKIKRSANDMTSASLLRALELLQLSPCSLDLSTTPYGLGGSRCLRDYERYAGLSFSGRAVHRSALSFGEPDPSHVQLPDEDWEKDLIYRRNMEVTLTFRPTQEIVLHSADVISESSSGEQIFSRQLDEGEIARLCSGLTVTINQAFFATLEGLPAAFLLRSSSDSELAHEFFSIAAQEILD